MNEYVKATQPTIYFIGVTTGSSSIMKVFPKWAEYLGLTNAVIKGFDFPLHAPPEEYRQCVEFIKSDPLSLGALVTTHKIDLYNSCKDLFAYVDPYAKQLSEISSISKRDGMLCAHAKDPISSGLALEAFVPKGFWRAHGGQVLLLGAGGSSLAMSVYLAQEKFGDDVPNKIILCNRSQPRLHSAEGMLGELNTKVKMAYTHNPTAADNDKTMALMPPYSLIVNATGLGKDAPGSPLTNDCLFPENSLVWEINYRGNLLFMDQANAQAKDKRLTVEDGWIYFIHGWTQVIAEVFHIDLADKIPQLSELAQQV